MDRIDQSVKLRSKLQQAQEANKALQKQLLELTKEYAHLNIMYSVLTCSYEYYSHKFNFALVPYMVQESSFFKQLAQNGCKDSEFAREFLKFLKAGGAVQVITKDIQKAQTTRSQATSQKVNFYMNTNEDLMED